MRYVPENKFTEGKHIYLKSRRDQDGTNWISLRIGSRRGPWQKQTYYRGSSLKAITALDNAGFNFDLEQFEEVRSQVQSLTKFESVTRFTQPGWTGTKFALSNGTVLSTVSPEHSIVGYELRDNHTERLGTHEKWLTEVAAPLAGCDLPEFCLMVMFAAPLLRFAKMPFNFGFELSGPPSTGKTTMAKVCASVAGPIGGKSGSYIETMNSTVNSLDATMSGFNDMPLILEEANLLTLGAGSSADKKYADLIFRLAEGRAKRRYDRSTGADARFVWLATTNRGWPELARSMDADTARAVADRMITLPIPSVDQGGVDGQEGLDGRNLSDLSRDVVTAAMRLHGSAIRKFVRQLQLQLKKPGAKSIDDQVASLIAKFCVAAQKKGHLADERLLRAFGLVYAAGQLAVDGGILPATFNPRRASIRTLARHLEARASIKSPLQALVDLVSGDGVLDLRKRKFGPTLNEVEEATCVLRERNGRVEVILTPEHAAALDLEVPRFLQDPAVTALLIRETARRLVYRNVVSLERQQVYVFRYKELMAKAKAAA